jgi:hexosaminidase
MSLVKLNTLHWHLSDDQGFTFESKLFPKLMTKQYYTVLEIQELIQFSKIRGIQIIPEIDMPGHVTPILEKYPEYSCFSQEIKVNGLAGVYETVLCAGKESVYSFVNALLEEVITTFKCQTIHLGGDEVPKVNYKKCPDCNTYLKNNNLNNYEELQGYFLKRISNNIQQNIIVWNDSLKGNYIPNNTTVQYWINKTPELKEYNKNKLPIIDSSMYHFYFDYPNVLIPLKRVYFYKSKFNNVLGLEACIWGERIKTNEQLETLLFPRLYALAEANWCNKKNYKAFLNNVKNMPKRVTQYDSSLNKKDERVKFWDEFLNLETVKPSETNKQTIKSQLEFFYYFMKLSDFKVIKQLKEKVK